MDNIFDPSTLSVHIKNKTPLWGRTNASWSWDSAFKFLDNHPKHLCDKHYEKVRIFLKSCERRPSQPQFAKDIVNGMRKVFHQNPISNYMFFGFGNETDSYPWHADKMDVFLVQVKGDVMIKVQNTQWSDTPRKFEVGDCVYIPRGTHHQVIAGKSRLTFSFGVEFEPDPATYI